MESGKWPVLRESKLNDNGQVIEASYDLPEGWKKRVKKKTESDEWNVHLYPPKSLKQKVFRTSDTLMEFVFHHPAQRIGPLLINLERLPEIITGSPENFGPNTLRLIELCGSVYAGEKVKIEDFVSSKNPSQTSSSARVEAGNVQDFEPEQVLILDFVHFSRFISLSGPKIMHPVR